MNRIFETILLLRFLVLTHICSAALALYYLSLDCYTVLRKTALLTGGVRQVMARIAADTSAEQENYSFAVYDLSMLTFK